MRARRVRDMKPHAIVIRSDRFELVFGDDLVVTAREMSGGGEPIRIEPATLQISRAEIAERGVAEDGLEALVIIADVEPAADGAGPVTVETVGESGAELSGLADIDPRTAGRMLDEAVAVAWWQPISDAVDTIAPITDGEAGRVGPLAIEGRPTLPQFKAERRRRMRVATTGPAGDDDAVTAVLGELIDRLRTRIRFPVALLAEKTDGPSLSDLAAAGADGGWAGDLRALLVAQECRAAQWVLGSRRPGENGDAGAGVRAAILADRADTELLVGSLVWVQESVLEGLLALPLKIVQRRRLQRAETTTEVVKAYARLQQPEPVAAAEVGTWEDNYTELRELDDAADHGDAGGGELVLYRGGDDEAPQDELTIEETAARLEPDLRRAPARSSAPGGRAAAVLP